MIGYQDIKQFTDEADGLYPAPGLDAHRQWWGERGVHYDGLVKFCAEDGTDTVEVVLPNFDPAGSEEAAQALLAGALSMSTEIGFLLGWLAHEKAHA